MCAEGRTQEEQIQFLFKNYGIVRVFGNIFFPLLSVSYFEQNISWSGLEHCMLVLVQGWGRRVMAAE